MQELSVFFLPIMINIPALAVELVAVVAELSRTQVVCLNTPAFAIPVLVCAVVVAAIGIWCATTDTIHTL